MASKGLATKRRQESGRRKGKEDGDKTRGGGGDEMKAGGGSSWAWKTKTENAKKVEALREIEQLEQKINNLDREKGVHLYNKRSDFRKLFCTLEEQELKLNSDRKTEKAKLRQQLNKMRGSVTKFQRELHNVKPTPEFVEKLKEIMETIESVVSEFKEQQKQIYEELLREEQTLNQEVTALEKRLESWASAPPITIETKSVKPKTVSSARNVIADLPPEVAAFERFLLQTGGHRGGWDEYDHGTFLRIRNKFKGKSAFLDEAATSIPGRNITDVRQHENWYQEYLTLMEKKKDGIQKWKIVKEAQKDECLTQAAVDEDEKKEEEEQKTRARARRLEEERREQADRLNAWKVQKELMKAKEEEKQIEIEMRRAKEYEKERLRQLEVRNQVQEYLQRKQEEDAIQRLEVESKKAVQEEEKKTMSREERVRFLERDQRRLEERLAKGKAKEEEQRKKSKRLERLKGQVEVQVERDPSRLYRLTEGWKERKKDTTSASNGPVLHMPHRAVPSWRAGL
ncbi:coiled-coil domain-containing protein 112-like [Patiria miniata]|uniref:Coiled-coil domain-containing protein 112 n=1 Tax=Patiria miniata TaxID=46514 RepID=A0A914BCK7_PATMI|nr:coiled-coil domain-containing protein 112-like [Patiria miniata]